MTNSAIFIPPKIGSLVVLLLTGFAMYEYTEYWWIWLAISLIVIVILFKQEHPKSTARNMAVDALPIEMPTSGGEGKSVVVIGGGISGLSAAKYLIQAGCEVTLLEQRGVVGGNNEPYLENGEHHATTVIITLPAQQPHYLQMCREFGLEQTPHEFENLKGSIAVSYTHLTLPTICSV